MTARPDVPDTPDRIDAIARIIWNDGRYGWHEAAEAAHSILATDDPAAVDAQAATLAERHPDALLTALTNAGVLRREGHCDSARAAHAEGDYRVYACADFDAACPPDRLVTPWREVQQP